MRYFDSVEDVAGGDVDPDRKLHIDIVQAGQIYAPDLFVFDFYDGAGCVASDHDDYVSFKLPKEFDDDDLSDDIVVEYDKDYSYAASALAFGEGTTTTTSGCIDVHTAEKTPVCGDGWKDPDEECDDGPHNGEPHYCRADCTKTPPMTLGCNTVVDPTSGGAEGVVKDVTVGNPGDDVEALLFYNTLTIPDRVTVYDGIVSSGKIVFQTEGCVSTIADCQGNGGVCISPNTMHITSGHAIVVVVDNGCFDPDTKWAFAVACENTTPALAPDPEPSP